MLLLQQQCTKLAAIARKRKKKSATVQVVVSSTSNKRKHLLPCRRCCAEVTPPFLDNSQFYKYKKLDISTIKGLLTSGITLLKGANVKKVYKKTSYAF